MVFTALNYITATFLSGNGVLVNIITTSSWKKQSLCKLSTGLAVVYLNSSCFVFKIKAEKADDVKARLILEKLEEDDAKTKAQQEMLAYVRKQEECQKEFTQGMNTVQVQSSL